MRELPILNGYRLDRPLLNLLRETRFEGSEELQVVSDRSHVDHSGVYPLSAQPADVARSAGNADHDRS